MSDLQWHDVEDWFDPMEKGSAPDLVVTDTTLDDWQALIALIHADGWRAEYEYRDRRGVVPISAADLFEADEAGWQRSIWVWPEPDIEVIFRPGSAEEIIGDVNLHELQGQERVDKLCAIMRRLGRALGRRVAMYAEGADESSPPMLAYEVDLDRVVFLAGS